MLPKVNQEAVQSILADKCRTVAHLRPMMMNLMKTTSCRIPGIQFAGAALQLFGDKFVKAIDAAEIVVATRLLYTDKTNMFFGNRYE